MAKAVKLDEVNIWTEKKLSIIREYIRAYATILAAPKQQAMGLQHIYIDGFSGAGHHISKITRARIEGSPLHALSVASPFKELYFVDANRRKVAYLEKTIDENYPDQKINTHVICICGDCNEILPKQIFPSIISNPKRRAVCLLDPYGMHIKWSVIKQAGASKKMDVFINFSTMDINMNALTRYEKTAKHDGIQRFSDLWGDNSWQDEFYATNLLGEKCKIQFPRSTNEKLAQRFQQRLVELAGFKCVPDPMPMKNKTGAVVYYLFFASYNDRAAKSIIESVFKKYRKS